MCTEANDLLKFRLDYIYQIRITFLSNVVQRRIMLLKKWEEGGRKMERKTGVIYG